MKTLLNDTLALAVVTAITIEVKGGSWACAQELFKIDPKGAASRLRAVRPKSKKEGIALKVYKGITNILSLIAFATKIKLVELPAKSKLEKMRKDATDTEVTDTEVTDTDDDTDDDDDTDTDTDDDTDDDTVKPTDHVARFKALVGALTNEEFTALQKAVRDESKKRLAAQKAAA